MELTHRGAVRGDEQPLAELQAAQRDAVEGRAAGEDRLGGASHARRAALRRNLYGAKTMAQPPINLRIAYRPTRAIAEAGEFPRLAVGSDYLWIWMLPAIKGVGPFA